MSAVHGPESYMSVQGIPIDTDWNVDDVRALTERQIEDWNATGRPWPLELVWRVVLLNEIDKQAST